MKTTYYTHLTDIIELPKQWDTLTSNLDDFFSRLGLQNYSFQITHPVLPPNPTPAGPPLTEEEAFELIEWFEGETYTPPPPVISTPTPIISVTPHKQEKIFLTLELQALSEVAIKLAGLDSVSLILNPDEFILQLTISQNKIELEFTVDLGIRFTPDLLIPMRTITKDDGSISFERDVNLPYVQIDLVSVNISIDHNETLSLSHGIGLQLSKPIMIGDTGIVIESADLELNLSGTGSQPTGTPPGWKGLYLNPASTIRRMI